jgi:hypothetical protein
MATAVEDKPPKLLAFPAPAGNEGKKDEPKPRGRPKGSTNRVGASMSISKIEESLATQFTMIGTAVYAFNSYDGTVILQGTPKLSAALANLCEKNPKVKKNIERMLAGGAYGEVIVAAAFIAIPIMANHGMMPPGIAALYGKAIPSEEEVEAKANA